MDSLHRLQGLHADLVALASASLANVDRLWAELDASLQDFRDLLEKAVPGDSPSVIVGDGEHLTI